MQIVVNTCKYSESEHFQDGNETRLVCSRQYNRQYNHACEQQSMLINHVNCKN